MDLPFVDDISDIADLLGFYPGRSDAAFRSQIAPDLLPTSQPTFNAECHVTYRRCLVSRASKKPYMLAKTCDHWVCIEYATTTSAALRAQVVEPDSAIFAGHDGIWYSPTVKDRAVDAALRARRCQRNPEWLSVTTFGGVRHNFSSVDLAQRGAPFPSLLLDVANVRRLVNAIMVPGVISQAPGHPRKHQAWRFHIGQQEKAPGLDLGPPPPPSIAKDVWDLVAERSEALFGFALTLDGDLVPDEYFTDPLSSQLTGLFRRTVEHVALGAGVTLQPRSADDDDPWELTG